MSSYKSTFVQPNATVRHVPAQVVPEVELDALDETDVEPLELAVAVEPAPPPEVELPPAPPGPVAADAVLFAPPYPDELLVGPAALPPAPA